MPWSESDVKQHNKAAAEDEHKRKVWVAVANETYDRTHDEARAIRSANAAVRNRRRDKHRKSWFGKAIEDIA